MNICSPFLPQGINKSCMQDLKEIKNILITTEGASFTSAANAASLAAWKTKLQVDLTAYVPLGINDYDPTTDDPNIVTMPVGGRKAVTNTPIPSAVFRLSSNFCDYKELMTAFKGGTFRMFFVDAAGAIFGTKTSTGVVKGFACTLNAVSKGMPLKEVANNFTLYANFLNYDEFEAATIITLSWSPTLELTEAAPIGLTLSYAGAYSISPGTIAVQINTRCGDGLEDLVVGDFEVLESNDLDTPAVTSIVDNDNGSYTLTIQKGSSPASLASGDYVVIRVKKVATTIVTYISGRLTVNA